MGCSEWKGGEKWKEVHVTRTLSDSITANCENFTSTIASRVTEKWWFRIISGFTFFLFTACTSTYNNAALLYTLAVEYRKFPFFFWNKLKYIGRDKYAFVFRESRCISTLLAGSVIGSIFRKWKERLIVCLKLFCDRESAFDIYTSPCNYFSWNAPIGILHT